MSPLQTLLSQPITHAVGWALLHFVWQGALIGLGAAATFRTLRSRAPQARYAAGCIALVLMLAAPVLTTFWLYGHIGGARERAPLTMALSGMDALAPLLHAAASWSGRVEVILPWLVQLWLLGVVFLTAHLVGGWTGTRRLQERARTPTDDAWQRRLVELANSMRIARPVWLLESTLVRVPTVVGWLRPVILLPVTATCGLTPRQLEAVLLHELAHIRRHDYLLNLIQAGIETLLFYHPAVWWVSRRVREERELCCDDVAVAACGDALLYARALVQLEGLRREPPRLVLAADGGSLLYRIHRLVLGPTQPTDPAVHGQIGGGLLTLLVMMGTINLLFTARAAEESARALRETAGAVQEALATRVGAIPEIISRSQGTTERPSVPRVSRAVGRAPAEEIQSAADTTLLRRLGEAGAEPSEERRRAFLLERAPAVDRNPSASSTYLDAVARIESPSGRRQILSAMIGSSLGAEEGPRTPLAVRTGPPAPILRDSPIQPDLPTAAEPQTLEEKLERVEGLKSPRERRRALSELLLEQASGHR